MIIMRRMFALSLLLLAAATSSAWSQANTTRVALVIGNASYHGSNAPLPNAIKDARAFAEELRRSNFRVDLKEDVNSEEMRQATESFLNEIQKESTALIYFNGLAIQVAKHTYLIPINAPIWAEPDVRREGLNIDDILAEMARKGAKVKLVILDASRNNPIERRFRLPQTGLAPINLPDGTLAATATAPDKIGSDMPAATGDDTGAATLFGSELIKQIRIPDVSAEDAFGRVRNVMSRASNSEQVPWISSTLSEKFVFRKAPQPPVTPPSRVPPPSPPPQIALKPGDTFRECPDCGELIVVPAGSFDMGSTSEFEDPVHRVTIAKPFAMGRREVTFSEWDSCVASGECKTRLDDRGWGRGDRPALGVTWVEAKQFLNWLSKKTGQRYRLPSEAEWEYAAGAGTTTQYWWGQILETARANCRECNTGRPQQSLPVGSFRPNPFGLYDTAGNLAEWVEDCWNDDYKGAPTDGSAWTAGQCRLRVLRGGGFDSQARYLRTTSRFRYDINVRFFANGFRVLREVQ
jgi:formylglycine-generating enzyme required for sulfatase activity